MRARDGAAKSDPRPHLGNACAAVRCNGSKQAGLSVLYSPCISYTYSWPRTTMAAVANGFLHNPPSGRSSTSSSPTSPSFHPAHIIQRLVSGRPSTPSSSAQVAGAVQLDPPPGVSYLDFVRQWTDQHVALWLQSCKCSNQAEVFADNDIRGDVVLDLDHATLKEMGIVSVGDRARIVNAVKQLRTKCHASKLITPGPPRVTLTNSSQAPAQDVVFPEPGLGRSNSKRGAGATRPPPLTLKPPAARSDVELVRTTGTTPRAAASTPGSANAHSTLVQNARPYLPPLPPVPRSQPPPPPSSSRSATSQAQQQRPSNLGLPSQPTAGRARTPTPEPAPPPAYTTQPLPPAPTPTPATPSHGWSRDGGYGLPSNPGAYRTSSPHQAGNQRAQQRQGPATPGHQKSSSLSKSSGATGHPYAMPSLEPPSFKANDLSPIAESFMSPSGQTPSTLAPPSSTLRGRPSTPLNAGGPGLDELRRKTLKVYLEDGGNNLYRIVNVYDCERGIDVLERVLKKFGKNGDGDQDMTAEGGLVLDGYGAFYDDSIGDGSWRCIHVISHVH